MYKFFFNFTFHLIRSKHFLFNRVKIIKNNVYCLKIKFNQKLKEKKRKSV